MREYLMRLLRCSRRLPIQVESTPSLELVANRFPAFHSDLASPSPSEKAHDDHIMKRANETDVLIIGAGPTGLHLACQLLRYGTDARNLPASPEKCGRLGQLPPQVYIKRVM